MALALLLVGRPRLARGALFAGGAAGVALGVVATLVWGRFGPPVDLAFGTGIASLAFLGLTTPRGRAFLAWRPLARIGIISYSVYVTHEPGVRIAARAISPTMSPWLAIPLWFVVVAGALLGIGYVFYLAVERPCLGLGRWLDGAVRRGAPGGQVAA